MMLKTTYLRRLDVAHHDNVTQSIYERIAKINAEESSKLAAASNKLKTAREEEDRCYQTAKRDFAAQELSETLATLRKRMSAVMGVLNAFAMLPTSDPRREKAWKLLQSAKDYRYTSRDGAAATESKVRNILQVWSESIEVLSEFSLADDYEALDALVTKIRKTLEKRIQFEASKEVGALANARTATDDAIGECYDVLNALDVLSPSAEITTAIKELAAIETRARQYYITTSGGSSAADEGGSDTQIPSGETAGNGGSSDAANAAK